jgi:hypothetical protein
MRGLRGALSRGGYAVSAGARTCARSAQGRVEPGAGDVLVGGGKQGRGDSRDHAFVGGEALLLHA